MHLRPNCAWSEGLKVDVSFLVDLQINVTAGYAEIFRGARLWFVAGI
jgi:hypothetical protein